MRRMFIVAVSAASFIVAACAAQNLTPSQNLENADTASSLAYASIATAANAYEAAKPGDAARAEAIKVQAWGILQQERTLYAQGQSVTALVQQLHDLQTQAKGL